MKTPESEKDRVIDGWLEASKPRWRECWACGRRYVGMRIVCGEHLCMQHWQAHCRDVQRRHPVSLPVGGIFYAAALGVLDKSSGDGPTD